MDATDRLVVRFGSQDATGTTNTPVDRTTDSLDISDRYDGLRMEPTQAGPLLEIHILLEVITSRKSYRYQARDTGS